MTTSTKVPDRFTPVGSEVTYLIQIPDRVWKLRYARAMKAEGGIVWSKADLLASARALLAEAEIQDADRVNEILDRYENLTAETPEEERDIVLADWQALARVLHGAGGDFAARYADNSFWFELSPLIAARCFLIGIEGQAPLKRGPDGLVPDEALTEHVKDEDHMQLIGFRALALFTPSEAEAKNSESPQPSLSSPTTSTAASNLSTDRAGSSSEKSTSEIQN
jgi:hypothetical protein